MTLDQVQAMRDKYFNAMLQLDLNQQDHSIGDASYSHDTHRANLQQQFEYWDKLYNVKSSAGKSLRLDKKAV